jgi:hypothetical protein
MADKQTFQKSIDDIVRADPMPRLKELARPQTPQKIAESLKDTHIKIKQHHKYAFELDIEPRMLTKEEVIAEWFIPGKGTTRMMPGQTVVISSLDTPGKVIIELLLKRLDGKVIKTVRYKFEVIPAEKPENQQTIEKIILETKPIIEIIDANTGEIYYTINGKEEIKTPVNNLYSLRTDKEYAVLITGNLEGYKTRLQIGYHGKGKSTGSQNLSFKPTEKGDGRINLLMKKIGSKKWKEVIFERLIFVENTIIDGISLGAGADIYNVAEEKMEKTIERTGESTWVKQGKYKLSPYFQEENFLREHSISWMYSLPGQNKTEMTNTTILNVDFQDDGVSKIQLIATPKKGKESEPIQLLDFKINVLGRIEKDGQAIDLGDTSINPLLKIKGQNGNEQIITKMRDTIEIPFKEFKLFTVDLRSKAKGKINWRILPPGELLSKTVNDSKSTRVTGTGPKKGELVCSFEYKGKTYPIFIVTLNATMPENKFIIPRLMIEDKVKKEIIFQTNNSEVAGPKLARLNTFKPYRFKLMLRRSSDNSILNESYKIVWTVKGSSKTVSGNEFTYQETQDKITQIQATVFSGKKIQKVIDITTRFVSKPELHIEMIPKRSIFSIPQDSSFVLRAHVWGMRSRTLQWTNIDYHFGTFNQSSYEGTEIRVKLNKFKKEFLNNPGETSFACSILNNQKKTIVSDMVQPIIEIGKAKWLQERLLSDFYPTIKKRYPKEINYPEDLLARNHFFFGNPAVINPYLEYMESYLHKDTKIQLTDEDKAYFTKNIEEYVINLTKKNPKPDDREHDRPKQTPMRKPRNALGHGMKPRGPLPPVR